MTLNSSAFMNLEAHFQQKQNEDSDDEDFSAMGGEWGFQRASNRWTRLGSSGFLGESMERDSAVGKLSSQESVLTDLASLHSNTSTSSTSGDLAVGVPTPRSCSAHNSLAFPTSLHSRSDCSPTHQAKSEGKPKKRRKRSFLKGIESLRRKEKEKLGSAKAHEGNGTPCRLCWNSAEDAKRAGSGLEGPGGSGTSPSLYNSHKTSLSTGCLTNQVLASVEDQWEKKPSPGGVDLESCPRTLDQPRKARGSDLQDSFQRDYLFHVPRDHTPGTFPKSLSLESLCPLEKSSLVDWRLRSKPFRLPASGAGLSRRVPPLAPEEYRPRRPSGSSTGSCTSLYDNVLELGSGDSFFDLDEDVVYDNLDDVIQQVWALQEKVELWSKTVSLEVENERGVAEEESDSGEEPSHLASEDQSVSDAGTSSAQDFESTANSLSDLKLAERRDSGVGASLTRPCRKLRWPSFQDSHRPSLNSASLEISHQSAAQLSLLQRCSLLRLKAILESHSVPPKQSWTWTVSKFMKKSRPPRHRDKMVFGVPLMVNVQRTGQPLPQSIQQAMRYIRRQYLDQVGIFRKSGVRSRIQSLREMSEASPENVNYEGQSAYDVADFLKQYFRDLPEPVFTRKLKGTFLQIYQVVPKEERLQAVRAAIMLMPDENREVLQTLLFFLSDVTSMEENQMTVGNLAVCLAPSIFHLNTAPRSNHRRDTLGKLCQKDLDENVAATQGLAHLIADCKKLFRIPRDVMLKPCHANLVADGHPPTLAEWMRQSPQGEIQGAHTFFESTIQSLLKESSEHFRGWSSIPGPRNIELSYKKVADRHPLRLWKVTSKVGAPPSVVLRRVLRERSLWDEDLLQAKVLQVLDKSSEVYRYATDSMAPHPWRDFVVLRTWRTDLDQGGCLLISSSVDYKTLPLETGVRALLLTSQYLMEPSGRRCSKVTHICRADLRGRSPDWYNKFFGHLCAMELARIRDSFLGFNLSVPETTI